MVDRRETDQELKAELLALREQNAELRALVDEGRHVGKVLSHERDLMQTLLDNIPDYIYFKDRDRKFVRASNSFCNLLKRSMENIIGKADEELFPESIARYSVPDDKHVIETGTPILNREEGGETIAGSAPWVLTTKLPWYDGDGNIIGLFGISRDITEHRRAEKQVRLAAARFRDMIEHTTDAVFCYEYDPPIPINLPADEVVERMYECTLADCNLVCARSYGANSVEEVVGKRLLELFGTTPHSLDKLFRRLIVDDYRMIDGEAVEELPDGGKRYFLNNATGVIDDGKLVYIWGAFRDITERKKADEALAKAQKLQSLGVLAGGIAHDFNNLLAGILGNVSLAHCESRDEHVSGYLETTLSAISRARSLSGQLLTFSEGGIPVREVGALFPFVEQSVQFALSGSNISCRFHVPDDLWPCNFDKSQIGQVIDNLVINAQQAMVAGGTIEVTARNVTFAENEHPALEEGDYVTISIRDSGIGISPEQLPRIFDPFYTTKEKGHGLGLSTSYSIVGRHGGYIDAESELGRGSLFYLYLPALPGSDVSPTRALSTLHKGNGTMLVIDDEKVVRDVIGKMLQSFGYSVVSKNDGKHAMGFLTRATGADQEIVGIILDLTIPGGMGGKEAIGEIRKLDRHMPVFVASGYADDPVVANPMEYGFTASISKPFTAAELSKMLNDHMRQ